MAKIDTILLVDDDEINNFLSERLLKGLDIANKVKVVRNGLEAIEYIDKESKNNNNNAPELILLDQHMPVMDGAEFLQEFQAKDYSNKEQVITVMLSAASEIADSSLFDNYNLSDFLAKPLTKEKVMALYKKYFVLS